MGNRVAEVSKIGTQSAASQNRWTVARRVAQARGPSAKYIFSNTGEGFLDPDYFNEYVSAPITKAAGLKVRFHELRPFLPSMLIAQGESPKYICDQGIPSTIPRKMGNRMIMKRLGE
jgi:hypothetical protein